MATLGNRVPRVNSTTEAQGVLVDHGYELQLPVERSENGGFVATAIKRVGPNTFPAQAGGATPIVALNQLVRTVTRP